METKTLIQIFLISKKAQNDLLQKYDNANYFKLPKEGTNPRGVEISTKAINELATHPTTKRIKIKWNRDEGGRYTPYERWVDLWK